MVGGKKTKPRNRDLMGSHQRCWLWGRNVVLETLRAGLWRPHEIVHAEDVDEGLLAEIQEITDQNGILLCSATTKQLRDLIRAEDHQGVAARMPGYPYRSVEETLAGLGPAPFVVVADGIQDPFNFGAILRSAEVLGADAVFVPTKGQTEITAQVVRSSAGAVNHLKIARAEQLDELLTQLRGRKIRLVGASEKATRSPSEASFVGPVGVVVGNEGAGLSEAALATCDELVAIPQSGRLNSLNAAVAAGILCYEVQRQRRARAKGG
jgi:23S rRNA (guanosine2251-2'-O)-methyltransferase